MYKKESISISIIGGDKRAVYYTEMMSKDKIIKVYGLEKEQNIKKNNNIKYVDLEEALKSRILILPIPLSKDKENLNAPYSKNKITLKKLEEEIEKENKIEKKQIIAGSILQEFVEKIGKNNDVIDLNKDEEFSILNAISTAEGSIKIVIENKETILLDENILILGYGRIGKILADRLKNMNANVYVTARKRADFAWIKAYGYTGIEYSDLDKYLYKFGIIINTIPENIIDKRLTKMIKKDTLLIELASNPGGFDKKAAEECKLNLITAPGIPGKIAPITSAEIMKKIIDKEITNLYN